MQGNGFSADIRQEEGASYLNVSFDAKDKRHLALRHPAMQRIPFPPGRLYRLSFRVRETPAPETEQAQTRTSADIRLIFLPGSAPPAGGWTKEHCRYEWYPIRVQEANAWEERRILFYSPDSLRWPLASLTIFFTGPGTYAFDDVRLAYW